VAPPRKEFHLHDWQANQVDNYERWRHDFYRNWAAEMSSRYGTVYVADTDWSDIQLNKGDASDFWKEYKNVAAVSILSRSLRERFGAACREVAAANTTRTCHACGHDNDGVGRAILFTCAACGVEWDIDFNNATNLLRAGRQLKPPGRKRPGAK
jgi:hypothetical protein